MPKWPDSYINANGLRIHYYRTGGNKPPVVINHGATDDGLCWTRLVMELEKDYDVILPDARGHGRSDSGKGDYSSQQRAADLAGLVQELKLDRPVVGGHSLGADTSIHLAANYPQLSRAIFLEDPPIFTPGEPMFGGEQAEGQDVNKMMRKFMLMFKRLPKFIGIRMARKGNPAYPDVEILPWVDSKRRMSMYFLNSMTANLFDSLDSFGPFEKIKVPVLLFIGDREKMSIVSKETAQKIAQMNEKVQVVHLEGASHDIRRTRLDGYLPALRKFLAEIYQA